MAPKASTASPNRLIISLATRIALLSLLAGPIPLSAQDLQAPERLEDLIPDAAVSDPETWATNGTPADAADSAEPDSAQPLEPDSPMAEAPGIDLPWPDETLELPQLAPLEPDDDIQFADITPDETDDAQPALADASFEEVSKELTLAFPPDVAAFPLRTEFVDRFKQLSTIRSLSNSVENIAQLSARARQDQQLLEQLLQVYGYYDAQIIRSVAGGRRQASSGQTDSGSDNTSRQATPSVRFDIIPGTRYRFGAIDLGQLDQAPDYPELRSAFEINTGDPMSSDAIVREQFDLDAKLGETGYPFAEIKEPELLVDHDRTEGDLTMIVLPKGKYVFGDVVSDLPKFLSGKHLQTIARFDTGDTFQRSLLLDLRRAITATGLVSSVSVTPREVVPPTAEAPGTVALDVAITKAKLRTISGAIGYGTEEGFRIEAAWEHRNLFPSEGSLRVRGIAGTQEQLLGVTFRKNNFGGRDRILTVDAYASTVDNNAYDAQTVALVGTYERVSNLLFQKPFSWAFGPEFLVSNERPVSTNGVLEARQLYYLAALPVRALLDSTDDLLDPVEGFRLGGRLSPEISRTNGAQSFYLRSQIDASYYKRITDTVVLAGRARVASIPGAALDNIAPSRRLYAGGGSSVRGFGYQQIGPRDTLGDPSGGRSLVEFSLEARVRTGLMDGAVSFVPFVDAGTVGPNPTPGFNAIKVGAGVGLRYYTGFGPIRVDVATPVNPDPGDSPIAVYVSLGQAF